MKIQAVLLLLFCVGFVSVSSQNTYCGRHLATTLDILCDGNLIKRSQTIYNSFELEWPWVKAIRTYGLRFRGKRQIVSECCEKPCTVDVLMTYCGI